MKDIIDKVVKNDGIVNEMYKDALQPSFKQVGKIGESLLKFVALPFSFLGMTAEQLEEKYKMFIARAIKKVPKDKREKPKAVIVSPLLDHIKYLFDDEKDDNLIEMFSELLANSINVDRKKHVHVSYVQTLIQLGPLEAEILEKMYKIEDDIDYIGIVFKRDIKQDLRSIEVISDYPEPVDENVYGYKNVFYYKHVIVLEEDMDIPNVLLLEALNILEHHNLVEPFAINKYRNKDLYTLKKHDESNINDIDPYRSVRGYRLTTYGKDFMSVCIAPEKNCHTVFHCEKCNYIYKNVKEDAKCPKCGKPGVELP